MALGSKPKSFPPPATIARLLRGITADEMGASSNLSRGSLCELSWATWPKEVCVKPSFMTP